MIYFLLTFCAFAECFLLRFLVTLIRESRHSTSRMGEVYRTGREPVGWSEELIFDESGNDSAREWQQESCSHFRQQGVDAGSPRRREPASLGDAGQVSTVRKN